jgi:hypothetical protein
VYELKERIEDIMKVSAQEQHLSLYGSELHDSATLYTSDVSSDVAILLSRLAPERQDQAIDIKTMQEAMRSVQKTLRTPSEGAYAGTADATGLLDPRTQALIQANIREDNVRENLSQVSPAL